MISNPSLRKERSPPSQTEVYVRNLPSNVDSNGLKSLFQTYGPVIDVRIPMTGDQKCRGLAFVEFEKEEHAKASLALNSKEFEGCVLNVSLSRNNRVQNEDTINERERKKKFKRKQEEFRKSDKQSKTVAFTKLPENTTEENIREMLSQDEAISKITMIPHDRCAHVEFKHIMDAGKAVLRFNNYKLNDTIISAAARSDLPSTLTEFAVQSDKPTNKMIPRRLMVPSNKIGIKRKSGAGSKS